MMECHFFLKTAHLMDGLWLLIPIFFETKGLGAGPVQISTGAWVVLAGVFVTWQFSLFMALFPFFGGWEADFFGWKTPICFFGKKVERHVTYRFFLKLKILKLEKSSFIKVSFLVEYQSRIFVGPSCFPPRGMGDGKIKAEQLPIFGEISQDVRLAGWKRF